MDCLELATMVRWGALAKHSNLQLAEGSLASLPPPRTTEVACSAPAITILLLVLRRTRLDLLPNNKTQTQAGGCLAQATITILHLDLGNRQPIPLVRRLALAAQAFSVVRTLTIPLILVGHLVKLRNKASLCLATTTSKVPTCLAIIIITTMPSRGEACSDLPQILLPPTMGHCLERLLQLKEVAGYLALLSPNSRVVDCLGTITQRRILAVEAYLVKRTQQRAAPQVAYLVLQQPIRPMAGGCLEIPGRTPILEVPIRAYLVEHPPPTTTTPPVDLASLVAPVRVEAHCLEVRAPGGLLLERTTTTKLESLVRRTTSSPTGLGAKGGKCSSLEGSNRTSLASRLLERTSSLL
mmetsp:Transcript_8320/g.15290  ORF Transcript_8320/g.15290 Transcript_8320/m.15290 type:complete len:353 (-) Transcript_8320:1959-3017(-)